MEPCVVLPGLALSWCGVLALIGALGWIGSEVRHRQAKGQLRRVIEMQDRFWADLDDNMRRRYGPDDAVADRV